MAYCDTETGEIVGARPGTLTYYHEEGHLQFPDTKIGKTFRFREEMSRTFMPIPTSLAILFPSFQTHIALAVFVIYWLFLYEYEEYWAWRYAFKKRRYVNEKNKA